jgi:hypothetical protein
VYTVQLVKHIFDFLVQRAAHFWPVLPEVGILTLPSRIRPAAVFLVILRSAERSEGPYEAYPPAQQSTGFTRLDVQRVPHFWPVLPEVGILELHEAADGFRIFAGGAHAFVRPERRGGPATDLFPQPKISVL